MFDVRCSTFNAFLPGLALLLLATALPSSAFVHENIREITSSGDFDGDGRVDIVIVERATGVYRIGYQLAPGTHTWVKTRSSGIENVTGLGVGRILNTARDALAFTAPDANRINIFDAASPAAASQPVSAFTPSIGPNLVTAIDIGGAGNTAHHDLFIGSVFNGASPNRYTTLRSDGASFTTLADAAIAAPLARGNRVLLKTGAAELAGVIFRGGASDTFRAYNLSSGALTQSILLTGLPTGTDYVFARFDAGSPLAQFLFYRPGQTSLLFRPVQEPAPGTFQFGAGTSFNLAEPISQVFALPGASSTKLLVLFGGGQRATVFNFDGLGAPVPLQTFNAPEGEFFSGGAVLANNDFVLLGAPHGATSSTRFLTMNFNGTTYVPGQSGGLPDLNPLSGSANVFLYRFEPFVNTTPHLLRSLNSGDWTSAFTLQAGPSVAVTVENFTTSSQGLANPSSVNLGSAHPLTQFGLVNQYIEPVSLFGLTPPLGDEVMEVKISPAPGLHKTSVRITLSTTVAGQIFYRLNASDNWSLYTGSFPLFKETTVSYYAKPAAGNAKSLVRHALYQFTSPPGTLDSDGDGVPDYVEIAMGLDPLGGSDTDGDGWSDLDELLAGFDPNNPASHPPDTHSPAELKAAFDLVQTLRPFDGTTSLGSLSMAGATVRAFDLNGSLFAFGLTDNLGLAGVTDPAVFLHNIVIDTEQRLLVAATDLHFDIQTAGADKTLGRELIGLIPVPNIPAGLNVEYEYSGGALATEAANWIAAAQAAQTGATREQVTGDLDIYDTLVALLVEQKVSEIFLSRGFTGFGDITLFPFRPGDLARTNPPIDELLALEVRVDAATPGFLLRNIYDTFETAVAPPGPGAFPELKLVTEEIYRVSSALNNSNPGTFPSPVDTLRTFLHTGILHSNYLAQTPSLTPTQLNAAFTGAQILRDSVTPRPTTNIVLKVRADTFAGGCVVLDTADLFSTRSLFHPNGAPYHLLQAFTLLPGTSVGVFGYTDLPDLGCGDGIEVIALSLDSVPAVTPVDTDGDLLLDALELLLFGDLSQDAFGDFDGDGFSNLQEILDGTDPTDPLSMGTVIEDLSPPEIVIEQLPGGELKLSFQWPEAYADKIKFGVLATDSLGAPFFDTLLAAMHVGGGQFELTLPSPGADAQFFLVFLALL